MGDKELSYNSAESKYTDKKFKTDNVEKAYDEDNKLNYPLLMLYSDKVELFRLEALKGMLKKPTFLKEGNSGFHVYMNIQDQIVGVGILPWEKLKVILSNKTFSVFDKKVYLDENSVYQDELLYALCFTEVI